MTVTLGMMPKGTCDPYFQASQRGAEEASGPLDVSLLWQGPKADDPVQQHETIEAWIARPVDVIAVSASDRTLIAPALRKARARGIHVLTWDADAEKDAREFFVVPASSDTIGQTLAFELGRVLRGKSEVAVITGSAAAANQGEWAQKLKENLARTHAEIELIANVPCHEEREAAKVEAARLLQSRPKLAAIVGLCSPAVPGAAEAVKAAGRKDVKVIGLSTPNAAREYVRDGWVESVVMWKPVDLGYLTVHAAHALAAGRLKNGDTLLVAGRLGKILVVGDEVRLGRPHIFTKTNIDQASF